MPRSRFVRGGSMTLSVRLPLGLPIALIALSLIASAHAESSDSDIAALRQELRGPAEKNQKQIDALQREVRDLKAALAKSRAAPPSRAAAAAAPGAPGWSARKRPWFRRRLTARRKSCRSPPSRWSMRRR